MVSGIKGKGKWSAQCSLTDFPPSANSLLSRDYQEHRKIMFHRKLLEQDWNHVNDNFDLDTAVNSLHSTLEKLMNECFPRKSIRMSSREDRKSVV